MKKKLNVIHLRNLIFFSSCDSHLHAQESIQQSLRLFSYYHSSFLCNKITCSSSSMRRVLRNRVSKIVVKNIQTLPRFNTIILFMLYTAESCDVSSSWLSAFNIHLWIYFQVIFDAIIGAICNFRSGVGFIRKRGQYWLFICLCSWRNESVYKVCHAFRRFAKTIA